MKYIPCLDPFIQSGLLSVYLRVMNIAVWLCLRYNTLLTTYPKKVIAISYFFNFCLFNPAKMVYHRFEANPGMRQTVGVTIDGWATTAGKCAMSCLSNEKCISFNFMLSPQPICELSSLPRDAQSANYGHEVGWAHYNIRLN